MTLVGLELPTFMRPPYDTVEYSTFLHTLVVGKLLAGRGASTVYRRWGPYDLGFNSNLACICFLNWLAACLDPTVTKSSPCTRVIRPSWACQYKQELYLPRLKPHRTISFATSSCQFMAASLAPYKFI